MVQVIFGFNEPIWVFQIQYNLPHIAKKVIRKDMGAEVQNTPERGLFVAYTLPPRTTENFSKPMKPLRGANYEL